jgi:hypothetical protein
MGKRSSFERLPRDFYPTPFKAVPPLIPYLRGVRTFAEPCCGDGALVNHLEAHGLRCVYQGDIADGRDALAITDYGDADTIITNPPYTRPLMHALIEHFSRILPTWLLLESDWAYTKQAGPFMPCCSDIVSVGRLRWIAGTTMSSKENFRLVPIRYLPPRRSDLPSAWFGVGVVAGETVYTMRQTISTTSFNSKVCSSACRQRAYRERLSVTQA